MSNPADASSQVDAALRNLDAMLDEIDAHWRSDQTAIYIPRARPGFTVAEDNGLPWMVAQQPLPLATVAGHLAQRHARNASLHLYANGTRDGRSTGSADEPIVLALNETLLVFVVPDPSEPSLLARVGVARP